jgi:hypothetical protein
MRRTPTKLRSLKPSQSTSTLYSSTSTQSLRLQKQQQDVENEPWVREVIPGVNAQGFIDNRKFPTCPISGTSKLFQ